MQTSLSSDNEYLSQHLANLCLLNEELCNIEFDGCEFKECDFTGAVFKKCKFIDCSFVRCNLSLVKVPQSQFIDTVFDECKLIGVDWTRAAWSKLVFSVSLKFTQCIINDSSFFGLNLDEITLEECKAHDVDFRDGSFCRANFTYTDFTHSLFGKTNLTGADFSEAENYDIDIFNNKITHAKFSRHEAVRLLNGLDIELVG